MMYISDLCLAVFCVDSDSDEWALSEKPCTVDRPDTSLISLCLTRYVGRTSYQGQAIRTPKGGGDTFRGTRTFCRDETLFDALQGLHVTHGFRW